MAVNTSFWRRVFPALSELLARGRPSDGTVTLDRRHVYILPTIYGLWFGALLMVMLIGSINYTLSLGYVLTFLLAGVLLTSMLHTYRNLVGLRINSLGSSTAFAGSTARFELALAADSTRLSVRVESAHADPVWVDVGEHTRVALGVAAPKRGLLKPGRFVLSSVYPLGLFRAWGYCTFNHTALIYPRPDETSLAPDFSGISGQSSHPVEREGQEDFAGLRAWHPGDAPRHVAWRIAARTGELATKKFSDLAGSEVLLDWTLLSGLDTEARLSRLTQWVLDAEQLGLRYALQLPGCEISAGNGAAHRHRCLEALALFDDTRSAR